MGRSRSSGWRKDGHINCDTQSGADCPALYQGERKRIAILADAG